MDDQLLQEFLAEAEDLIEVMFGDIKALRARHGEGRARRELVGRIFRHIHTVKGSSAAAGLEAVSDIAHEFESLLDAVRMGRVRVDDAVLDAFEDAVETIAQSLQAAARGAHSPETTKVSSSETTKVSSPLVERLRALAFAASPRTPPSSRLAAPAAANPADASFARAHAALPEDIKQILSEYELHRLREATGEGARLYVVEVEFGLDTFDEQFRNLSDALAEGGEVVSTLPGMDAGAFDRVNFRILYAAQDAPAQVAARIDAFGAKLVGTTHEAAAEAGAQPEHAASVARAGDIDAGDMEAGARARGDAGASVVTAGSAAHATAAPATGARDVSAAATLSSAPAPLPLLVRVPLDVLDEIISSTHELFTDTVAALEVAAVAVGGVEKAEMEKDAAHLRRRFYELEESLINLRMVTLERTLERAERAGRSVARAAGKEVNFEMAGGEVRIDKSLADAIADPLLHLLRNAIDHGIESPAERASAGKSLRGLVRVEARSEGTRVSLRVSDDGRGLDVEQIARAAVEQGLVAEGARVSEQQLLRLIFRPGFTTRRELSSVSGRGVGLEVVEHAVEQFGGELRVSSRPGRGTAFEMRLPTTLALVPAFIVHSAGQRYCVDARHVVEAGRIAASQMREQDGAGVALSWRGARVPLVRMRELLGQDATTATTVAERNGEAGRAGEVGSNAEAGSAEAIDGRSENSAPRQMPFIISRVARRKTDERLDGATEHAAVLLDGLEGEREVLVRTLGRHATRWRGISGATELRDGTVALMLDLPRLLEMRL